MKVTTKTKGLLLILALIMGLSFGLSANESENWDHYSIMGAVQDYFETQSTMWLATDMGLIAVDKNSLEKRQFSMENSDIPSNAVESIDQDDLGNIWIGTYDNLIAKFNPETEEWTSHQLPSDLQGVQYARMNSIAYAENTGIIWIGSSQGLISFDGTNWSTHQSEGAPEFISEIAIQESTGAVFAAGLELYRFINGQWTELSSSTNLFTFEESTVMVSSDSRVWFGTDIGQLGSWNGTEWMVYSGQACSSGSSPSISEDKDGNMYLLAGQIGLFYLEGEQWNILELPISSFSNWEMTSFKFDSNDHVWAASENKLVLVDKNGSEQEAELKLTTDALDDIRVNDVFLDANDKVYFTNGPNIIDKVWTISENGIVEFAQANETASIWEGQFDKHGQLWTAKARGVEVFDGETFHNPFEFDVFFSESNIWTMEYNEVLDEFWFGGAELLYQYKVGTNELINHSQFILDLPDQSSTTQNYVLKLHIENSGKVWSALGALGLGIFENGEWTRWSNALTGLPAGYAVDVFVDEAGDVFAGIDGGIWTKDSVDNWEISFPENFEDAFEKNGRKYLLTQESLIVENEEGQYENLEFPEQTGLVWNRYFYNMEMDAAGNIWISSTDGMYVYNENGIAGEDPVVSAIEVIDNSNTQSGINVFPNPVIDGNIRIELAEWNNSKVAANLYDLKGKRLIVMEEILSDSRMDLRVDGVEPGFYILTVSDGVSEKNAKIIIR